MQGTLERVLKRYFAAMRAGKLDEVLEFSSRELRDEVAEVLSTEEERNALIERQRSEAPESFKVLRMEAEEDEDAVSLLVLTPGVQGPSRILVTFCREGRKWKVAGILAVGEEAPVERPENDDREDVENYNFDATSSLFGRIVRTAYLEEYCLIVVGALNKEFHIYTPPRQWLEEQGMGPEVLVAGAQVEIESFPHRTNELKGLMKNLTVG